MAIQTFVAKLAVEAFDEGILHGFTRPNEIQAHIVGIRPCVHGAADEVRWRSTSLSTAATFTPVSDRSATSASDSRVYTSSTVNVRNQRPSTSRALTKSMLQRSF